ncbi:MAG: curved DNA-binding protein CbpA, partial [Pirellulaceae bacterium]
MDLTKYYTGWLTIPLEECPPNHYRLLNLPTNAPQAAIQSSSDELVSMLTPQLSGDHAAAAAEMLQQVIAARSVLSDAASRASYDQQFAGSGSAIASVISPTAAEKPLRRAAPLKKAQPLAPTEAEPAVAKPAPPAAQPILVPKPASASPTSDSVVMDAGMMSGPLPPKLPNKSDPNKSEANKSEANDPNSAERNSAERNSAERNSAAPILVSQSAGENTTNSELDMEEDSARIQPKKKANPLLEVVKIGGGSAAGILIGLLILGYGLGRGPFAPRKDRPKPTPEEVVIDDTQPEPPRRRPPSRPSRVNPSPVNPSPVPLPFSPGDAVVAKSDFVLQPADFEDLVVQAPRYVFTAASAASPFSMPAASPGGPPTQPNNNPNSGPINPSNPARGNRLPVPPDADLARGRGLVNDVYEDQFTAMTSPRAFQNLARTLQTKSREPANKGAVQYVLLEEAANAAGDGHDIVLAWSVLDELSSLFEGNVVDKREAALRKCSEVVKRT